MFAPSLSEVTALRCRSLNNFRTPLLGTLVFLFLCDGYAAQQVIAQPQASALTSVVAKISDQVDVPAEFSGKVMQVLVHEGQQVKAGELLANISDIELRLRRKRAELEYDVAKSTAENDIDIRFSKRTRDVAEADLQRSEESNRLVPNSIPTSLVLRQRLERDRTQLQVEQAERDFNTAKLKLQLTQNEIALADAMLAKTRILSPMDAVVVSVDKKAGEWVEASEKMFKLVRVDRLRVDGFVDIKIANRLKIGSPVQVNFNYDWLNNKTRRGKISFVNPEANPLNMQVQIWAEIENPEQDVLPGLNGKLYLEEANLATDSTPEARPHNQND